MNEATGHAPSIVATLRRRLDRAHERRRTQDAIDFLPAAREIRDRPPSRTARAVLWVLVGLVCSAVLWAYVGHVDRVAVAHGKIVPSGRSKVVQPLATASVVAIHVRDGQRVRAGERRAAIDELAAQREQLASGSLRETLARATELETRVAALRAEDASAAEVQSQQRLVAPVTGVVQQLRAHTVGGVVTPAEPLLVIVPDGQALEIEAQVLNKDVGWVHEGQPARVKLEAFPFTRYGVVEGEVVDVSNDALVDERLGLVYAARVKVTRTAIRVERRDVPPSPGMAVSVEVKTGTRRLIDYFLSPIQRHVDESLSER